MSAPLSWCLGKELPSLFLKLNFGISQHQGVRRVEFLGGVRRCISVARVGIRFGGAWSSSCFGVVGLVLSSSVFVCSGLLVCLAVSPQQSWPLWLSVFGYSFSLVL